MKPHSPSTHTRLTIENVERNRIFYFVTRIINNLDVELLPMTIPFLTQNTICGKSLPVSWNQNI